jgi:hypothetical protein
LARAASSALCQNTVSTLRGALQGGGQWLLRAAPAGWLASAGLRPSRSACLSWVMLAGIQSLPICGHPRVSVCRHFRFISSVNFSDRKPSITTRLSKSYFNDRSSFWSRALSLTINRSMSIFSSRKTLIACLVFLPSTPHHSEPDICTAKVPENTAAQLVPYRERVISATQGRLESPHCFNGADHALDAAGEGVGVLARDVLAYDDLRTGRLVIPS